MSTSELVDAWISAWRENDPEKMRSIFAEEFEYCDIPTKVRLTDFDGIRDILNETYTMSPDIQIEITSRHESENLACVEWILKSTYNGTTTSTPGCSVMVIRDGELVSNHDHWDMAGYLVQCGRIDPQELYSGETDLSSK